MNDDMLISGNGDYSGSRGMWHRSQRELNAFEAACWYTEELGGCQYNRSTTESWSKPRSPEIDALTQFYELLNGYAWRAQDNWLRGDPCWDGWFGIECDVNGYVISISLPDNHCIGRLEDWEDVKYLKKLQKLALYSSARVFHGNRNWYHNVISGPLPSFSNNKRLRVIDMGYNHITGFPSDLYLNGRLELLSLPHNRLTELPRYMHVFERMHTLDLSHNRIESNIPSAFGNMVELRQVKLADNNLKGAIPQGITAMSKCQTFDVRNNAELEGEFPLIAPHWERVEYVSIMGTAMTGIMASLCSDVDYCFKFMFDTHLDMTWVTDGVVSDQIVATLQLAKQAAAGNRRLEAEPLNHTRRPAVIPTPEEII
jgi:hypothetical protein